MQRGQRIGVEDLHGHVVRARFQVRGDAAGDRRRVAVHRERVDQRVAASAGQVGVRPAERAQVADVVGEAEVRVPHARPADGAGPFRVGLEHELLLRGEQRPVAEDLARLPGVLRRDQVGQRPGGALGGQPQDPGAEGGQRPARGRDLELVELVQVADELVVRPLVLLGGFRMPDPEAEQEAIQVPGGNPVVGGGHRRGVVLPHVDDAGAHHDALRRVQQLVDDAEVSVRRPAQPDGAVAQRLHLGHYLRGEPGGVPPDTDRAQFDAHATED